MPWMMRQSNAVHQYNLGTKVSFLPIKIEKSTLAIAVQRRKNGYLLFFAAVFFDLRWLSPAALVDQDNRCVHSKVVITIM